MSFSAPKLTTLLGIEVPLIVSPMFLVSNEAMVRAAVKAGATAALPAHNYRDIKDFKSVLAALRRDGVRPYGVNLITNKSNPYFKAQLDACVEAQVDFIITALGSPKPVMAKAKSAGIKVFCDVATFEHAQKALAFEPDALIVLNDEGGGHLGYERKEVLLPRLAAVTNVPLISAGGVGTGKGMAEVMRLGACGVSMGSRFIATHECGVSEAYKEACVQYGAKDIVVTKKVSGVPLTIINTPYAQQIGTEQTALESFLNKNKRLKKWLMTVKWLRSMKVLEQAAHGASYKTLWCAGTSIEHTHSIQSIQEIIDELKRDFEADRAASAL